MAQDPTVRDRPQSFLYIRVNGRAFIYSNAWTPTPDQLNRSPEMGGFKKYPGDSNVQSGRVERLLQSRAAHTLCPNHWGSN